MTSKDNVMIIVLGLCITCFAGCAVQSPYVQNASDMTRDGNFPRYHMAEFSAAQALMAQGQYVDSASVSNRIALYIAAARGDMQVATYLLDHGVTPSSIVVKNYTPLMCAIWGENDMTHPDMVDLLLARGADVNVVNPANGVTPLILCAKYGNAQIAQALINAGADVDVRDKQGKSAADYAAEYKNSGVLDVLGIDPGTQIDAESLPDLPKDELLRRQMVRAQTAVETAQSPADFRAAEREYLRAMHISPETASIYYNIAQVQEILTKYDAAIANLKKYLELAPQAADAQTVRDAIYKLEFKKEKRGSRPRG